MSGQECVMDIRAIQKTIPHRYPFLLIDRVVEFHPNEKVVALKAVSANEPFFAGHFPGEPVMPGVLILEAMAQTGAILAVKSPDGVEPGKTMYLVGAQDVKFKQKVVPGDILRIEMLNERKRRPLWIMKGQVFVGDTLVASATIRAAEGDA